MLIFPVLRSERLQDVTWAMNVSIIPYLWSMSQILWAVGICSLWAMGNPYCELCLSPYHEHIHNVSCVSRMWVVRLQQRNWNVIGTSQQYRCSLPVLMSEHLQDVSWAMNVSSVPNLWFMSQILWTVGVCSSWAMEQSILRASPSCEGGAFPYHEHIQAVNCVSTMWVVRLQLCKRDEQRSCT